MLRSVCRSRWVPFFLVLLFYQVNSSDRTSLDQSTDQLMSLTSTILDGVVTIDNPNMDNTIPTDPPNIANEIGNKGTTSPPQFISNEIPTEPPNTKYTTSLEDTNPKSRDVTEATPLDKAPPVFKINPNGGVDPVSVTRGKTRISGRIKPVVVVNRPTRRRIDVPEIIVDLDESIAATTRTRPDRKETKVEDANELEVSHIDKLEYLIDYVRKKHGTKIDFAKLLTQYAQVCPVDEPCNLLTPSIQKYTSTFKNEFECPYFCVCDVGCVSAGICCPGSIYAYTDHECINVQVYPPIKTSTYSMVTTCPATYEDQGIKQQCEGHRNASDAHSNVHPVTSRDTLLTYRNRFCALCNGDNNITKWTISVSCPSDIAGPVDDFRSYSEMKEYLDKHNCELAYDMEENYLKPPTCNTASDDIVKVEYVNRCNATGLWFEEDSDIRWGCEHFNGRPFLNFKNIFCFLCNPSIVSSNMPLTIDRCNISNGWDVYDEVLESACLNQPAIPRLFPYKNVYCLMCNGVKTLSMYRRDMYRTDTMEKSIDEETNEGRTLASTLTMDLDFISENNLSDLTEFIMDVYGDVTAYNVTLSNSFERFRVSNEAVDQQVNDYFSVCGHTGSCATSNESYYGMGNPVCGGFKACSCDPKCIELRNCCADFILKYKPYSCFSQSSILQFRASNSTPKQSRSNPEVIHESCYSFVDKCMNISDMKSHLNLTETQLTFLSGLPVTHGRATYRNISYMLCNVDDFKTIHIDITLQCDSLFEKSLIKGLSNFQSLINLTKRFCKAIFLSDKSKLAPVSINAKWGYVNTVNKSDLEALTDTIEIPTSMLTTIGNKSQPQTFMKCNQTGIWRTKDDNIISICEADDYLGTSLPEYRINDLLYKNYACYICNPEIDEAVFPEEDIISSCNITGLVDVYHEEAETLCRDTERHSRWLPFKNYYCNRCNLPDTPKMGADRMTTAFASDNFQETYHQSTYRTLFSLSFNDFSMMIKDQEIPECINGTYDYALEMCRPLYCRVGRVLQNDTCKPLLENGHDLSYKLALSLSVVKHKDRADDGENTTCETKEIKTTEKINLVHVLETFKRTVSDNIRKIDPDTAHSLSGCEISTDIHCLHPNSGYDTLVYVNMLTEIHILCTLYVFKTNNKTTVESVVVDTLTDVFTVPTEAGNNVCLTATPKSSSITRSGDLNNEKCFYFEPNTLFLVSQQFFVDRFFTCVQIKLDGSEFKVNNLTGDLELIASDIVIKRDFYKLNDTAALMCLKDYTEFSSTANNTDIDPVNDMLNAYAIFSEVCTLLSMVCLFITFVTYCLFRSLRTVPGKNNMALCFCLFCAQGTLQFGLTVNDVDQIPLCTIMGMLIHYFWLATFFAMNICSFHMFRVFCSNAMSVPSSSKRRFSKYIIFLFGMPFVIVTVTFTTYFVSSDATYTGYGGQRCFLTNIYGIIGAFIVPSSIIFLANIIFFIAAFHKIRTSPRIQSSGDKREFFLYVKLCTVVGLTWPLQIVDAVLPLTIFSFIVVGLNASQGVFVFLSYVCNRRVMFLYKRICSKDKAIINSGTTKSNSTELTDRSNKNSA